MGSMKRLVAATGLAILLASCGSSGGTAEVACNEQFWDGEVAVCLPTGWSIVDRETLADRGVPDEVLSAFQADKTASGQFPTVTVTKETLTEKLDSTLYSEASIKSVKTLPAYTLIDTQEITVDGKDVGLHIFTAQPVNDEPARRFYQVSAVSKGEGYTVTGLAPVTAATSLDKEIQLILKSTSFRKPTGSADQAANED